MAHRHTRELVGSAHPTELTRAVFVINREGKIVHAEYVPEVTSEPNYADALKAVKASLAVRRLVGGAHRLEGEWWAVPTLRSWVARSAGGGPWRTDTQGDWWAVPTLRSYYGATEPNRRLRTGWALPTLLLDPRLADLVSRYYGEAEKQQVYQAERADQHHGGAADDRHTRFALHALSHGE